jgi:uncharacterized membrane protein YphA (DoxX/SURF4 family)
MNTKTYHYYIERICSIFAAIILLQTLYFKFSGAPESVHIFTTLGVEPWGRIGTGIIELICGILLLIRKTSLYGAVLGLGVMGGAIASHLFILGIEILGDGGFVFILAIVVSLCCVAVIYLQKEILLSLLKRYNLIK